MRFPVLCLLVVAVGCASSKKSGRAEPKVPPELAQIAELEDRRSLGPENKLYALARTHSDPVVRARALIALGRIQDLESLDTILNALTDEYPAVRIEAAFAASLIGLSWQKLNDRRPARLRPHGWSDLPLLADHHHRLRVAVDGPVRSAAQLRLGGDLRRSDGGRCCAAGASGADGAAPRSQRGARMTRCAVLAALSLAS